MADSLVLTDPQAVPDYGNGALSRYLRSLLHDPRDEVFVRLTVRTWLQFLGMMALLFAGLHWGPALAAQHPVLGVALHPITLAAVYLVHWGYFVSPVILMLHCTMHRPFLKSFKLVDRTHPFVMAYLLGIPAGYREHHIGMHHAEDNMPGDLSSTLRYQRDSFAHFLVYFARFFFFSAYDLTAYLTRNNKPVMARRALGGEVVHLSLIALTMWVDWRFGLIAFALPYFTCRFMMMVGNWGQHAFINVEHKNNGIANSITCINSAYNQRCFNDGYHVGHHMRAARHWSEMPKDFDKNREVYAKEGAVVFQGIDFFMVSVLLFLGRFDVLAKRYVRLGAPMTDAEVIAMLKARLRPVRVWEAESLDGAHA